MLHNFEHNRSLKALSIMSGNICEKLQQMVDIL